MIKLKRISTILFLLVIAVFALTACGKKEDKKDIEEIAPTPEVSLDVPEEKDQDMAVPTPTPLPPRDLGAIDIVVADWWSTEEPAAPTTVKEEDQLAYREEIQTTHNFTLKQTNIGAWAEYQELFITSTMSGAPLADIFIMDPKFVPEPLKQGLFYPLSDLPSFDFTSKIWNAPVTEFMTVGGKAYGFSEDQQTPGLGVFFNKRLFEEAGLEPDLLYDLQKSGEWNWAKFEEIASTLTRDTNADGITDVYGVGCWQVEVVKAAVFSNGSDYVRLNETTGRYENNQNSDEYLAGVEFAVNLFNKGYIMPDPEGAAFTWFEGAFVGGQTAMMVTEWYRNSALQNMEDDWGYVFFPVGPSEVAKMQTMYTGNVRIMPSTLDAERADAVAFAYSKWVGTIPGYEDEETDYSYYYTVTRDTRSVEETIIPMVEGQGIRSLLYQVPGLSFKYGSNMDGGGLGAISAIEISEAASAQFDALIADFYAD